MRSTDVLAYVLAFAASTLAQTAGFAVISAPTEGDTVASGATKTIQWAAGTATGKVTISLLGGASPSTLQVLGDLSTGVDVTSGSFAWAVDCSLGTDTTYGIKITSETDAATFQYSFPFAISGPSCGASSSSSSVASVASTASASSSATVVIDTAATGYPTGGYPVDSTSVPSYPTVPTTVESVSSTLPASSTGYPTTSLSVSSSVPPYPTGGYPVTSAVTTPSYPVSNTTVAPPPTYPTVTPGNSTYITSAPSTTLVPSTTGGYPTTSTSTPPIPTAAAVKTGGSLALVAGIAFAVLAL
ncbi:Ser-Thr-rich glycosyl-phosphatidyl-inositol-anchored membrane family-domain-containing protein [Biscogniauxia sp. FL1348]|nr:Ser-Thr-rich glycosyl-phosphatidyl-inositol-anchored membrane family-domain-containing protein [Biscogniauxia sp. FL1348]